MRPFAIAVLGALMFFAATAADWRQEKLPPLPVREGVAGVFAGISGESLLVAGGANFPDKKPWQGGKKVWHDTVFALDRPDGKWRIAGKLPRPLAYGVSVTHRGSVVCAGGSDEKSHYSDVLRLKLRDGQLITTKLPPLPLPLANACGARVGDLLYVAGGLETPEAKSTLKKMFALDLGAKNPRWREREAWPGPARMLAVAAAFDGAFWLIGGVDLVPGKDDKTERRYLKDVYRYRPGKGWERLADLPRAAVAAPSPAPVAATGPLLLGGDDGTQIGVAPERHRGFARTILRYETKSGQWIESGELLAPRVTTPATRWKNAWIIPSGEVRPGIRSPEVWSIR